MDSQRFKEQNKEFLTMFTQKFSENWDIEQVSQYVTDDLYNKISSPRSERILDYFRNLGSVITIHEVKMQKYNVNDGIKTVNFALKTQYEYADVYVTIMLIENQKSVKVAEFQIVPIDKEPFKTRISA